MFQWSTKKDQAFLTVHCLRKIKEYQVKELRRLQDIDAIAKNLKLFAEEKQIDPKQDKEK